ncbi:hypothetical protein, partial [Mycoplana rhizolycopersici]|uniref:hypothetical protein n=1 Tax=Mycoplana rhizolycopersici TaxID=2746702 RepID=UPI001AEEBC26
AGGADLLGAAEQSLIGFARHGEQLFAVMDAGAVVAEQEASECGCLWAFGLYSALATDHVERAPEH